MLDNSDRSSLDNKSLFSVNSEQISKQIFDLLKDNTCKTIPLTKKILFETISKLSWNLWLDINEKTNDFYRRIYEIISISPIRQDSITRIYREYLKNMENLSKRRNILWRILIHKFEHLFFINEYFNSISDVHNDVEKIESQNIEIESKVIFKKYYKDIELPREIIPVYFDIIKDVVWDDFIKFDEQSYKVFEFLLWNGDIKDFLWTSLYENELIEKMYIWIMIAFSKKFINYEEYKRYLIWKINSEVRKNKLFDKWNFSEKKFFSIIHLLFNDIFNRYSSNKNYFDFVKEEDVLLLLSFQNMFEKDKTKYLHGLRLADALYN